MQTNRVKYFRWTPRTARITFMYAVFVPVLFGIVAYQTDVSRTPVLKDLGKQPADAIELTRVVFNFSRASGICEQRGRAI
jgi:hypothetical protein